MHCPGATALLDVVRHRVGTSVGIHHDNAVVAGARLEEQVSAGSVASTNTPSAYQYSRPAEALARALNGMR